MKKQNEAAQEMTEIADKIVGMLALITKEGGPDIAVVRGVFRHEGQAYTINQEICMQDAREAGITDEAIKYGVACASAEFVIASQEGRLLDQWTAQCAIRGFVHTNQGDRELSKVIAENLVVAGGEDLWIVRGHAQIEGEAYDINIGVNPGAAGSVEEAKGIVADYCVRKIRGRKSGVQA